MNSARMSGCTLTISRPDGRSITVYCTDDGPGEEFAREINAEIVRLPIGVTVTVTLDARAQAAIDGWFAMLDRFRNRIRCDHPPTVHAQRSAPAQWKRERSPMRYRGGT
ncbi:hypothetical protein ACVBR5_000909 [Burkholderia cenocepacia]